VGTLGWHALLASQHCSSIAKPHSAAHDHTNAAIPEIESLGIRDWWYGDSDMALWFDGCARPMVVAFTAVGTHCHNLAWSWNLVHLYVLSRAVCGHMVHWSGSQPFDGPLRASLLVLVPCIKKRPNDWNHHRSHIDLIGISVRCYRAMCPSSAV